MLKTVSEEPREDRRPAEIISADNHEIRVADGHIHVRVWKRADISLERGAALAQHLAERMVALAARPADEAGYAVLDISEAPRITGPVTRGHVGRLLDAWEQAARPIIFAVGDQPIKDVQFHGLVVRHAPIWGRVTAEAADAHHLAAELGAMLRRK